MYKNENIFCFNKQNNKMFIESEWEKVEVLGEGTYGIVYKMKKDDEEVAYKEFKSLDFDYFREIAIHKLLNENIIAITARGIVLKLANGTLADYATLLSFDQRLVEFPKILRESIKKLTILHEYDIIHGDLKAQNILCWWDSNGKFISLSLSDFGRSSSRPDDIDYSTYRPSLERGLSTKASDVWCLGFSLYQFISRKNIINSKGLTKLYLTKDCDYVMRMLNSNKRERPILSTLKYRPRIYNCIKFQGSKRLLKKTNANESDIIHAIDILHRFNPTRYILAYAMMSLSLAQKWGTHDTIFTYEYYKKLLNNVYSVGDLKFFEMEIFRKLDGLIYLPIHVDFPPPTSV